jgi:glucokinase
MKPAPLLETTRAIGIDIGGTQIKCAAFCQDGQIIDRWTHDTEDNATAGVPAFAKTVRRLLTEINPAGDVVGIAAPGLPAKDGRSIAFQPGKMHGIEGFDWTDFLKNSRTTPVLNDAHAALLGEVWQGAARDCQNAILLTLGTGVGGAIWSDGRLLRGAIGRAGHLGHVSINEDAERSIFGMTGSLEAAVGNYTVKQRSAGRFDSTRELVQAHVAGDTYASEVWLRSVRSLARAIASFINCLDPEVVILGGGIAQAGTALFEPLEVFLRDLEWQPAGNRVKILPAQLGEWAGTYGAAWNALNQMS